MPAADTRSAHVPSDRDRSRKGGSTGTTRKIDPGGRRRHGLPPAGEARQP